MFTKNRLADLRRCIASVRKQSMPPAEIVVVDNGSTDGTLEWLETQDLTIHRTDRKHLAYVFNFGWRKTREPFVLFLADDAELSASWAEYSLSGLRGANAGAVAGPLISTTEYASEMHRLYETGRRNIVLRPLVSLYVALALENRPFEPCRYFESGAYSFGQGIRQDLKGARYVDLLTTTSMLIRRDALESVNGFDETYWFNHADGDLFLRLAAAGWRLVFTPEALAWHHVRMGPSRDPYIIGRDTAIFHRRHLRPRSVQGVLGAVLNILTLNWYWVYAAIAHRDVRQLRGISGYFRGLSEAVSTGRTQNAVL